MLDNAIEASDRTSQPEIAIKIGTVNNYISAVVQNRVKDNVLLINPEMSTSKPNREQHGMGVKIIRSIVEKYDGSKEMSMYDDFFVVDILLKMGRN